MSVFSTGGSIPPQPDLNKTVTSAVGAVAGGTAATFTPAKAVDGISILHKGNDPDIALRITYAENTADGFVIDGDKTQIVTAGGGGSITFDDTPGNSNAVLSLQIEAVSLAGIVAGTAPTLGSALPAAAATDTVPYVVNAVES